MLTHQFPPIFQDLAQVFEMIPKSETEARNGKSDQPTKKKERLATLRSSQLDQKMQATAATKKALVAGIMLMCCALVVLTIVSNGKTQVGLSV